ncbi:uncharacterized protein TRAVEDRAFT_50455 [Trametes versicolor FP-101664 SS1]|uniref:uncharacterized protein n=1 Tax=Trametes versicolor (strain FP-101664) TaxID=717944 RepID=UPI0004624761|nr:uncharacterized protein TRAVEDRAFT_50455 [Trametes versicolor FP-101664 SS1]EIW55965.1 hypothetical protein TRAVEDRAFT_50455 [Trametes versicolor FP-101664 SS1]
MSFVGYFPFVSDVAYLSPLVSEESPASAAPETPPLDMDLVDFAQFKANPFPQASAGAGTGGYDSRGLRGIVGDVFSYPYDSRLHPKAHLRVSPITLEDDLTLSEVQSPVSRWVRTQGRGRAHVTPVTPVTAPEGIKDAFIRGPEACNITFHGYGKENVPAVGPNPGQVSSHPRNAERFFLPDVGPTEAADPWLDAAFDAIPDQLICLSDDGPATDTWCGLKRVRAPSFTLEDSYLPPPKKAKIMDQAATHPTAGPSTAPAVKLRKRRSNSKSAAKHKRARRRSREDVDALLVPDCPNVGCPVEGCTGILNASRRTDNLTHLKTHYVEGALHSPTGVKCLWCPAQKKLVPGNALVDHVGQKHLHAKYRCPYWDKEGVLCTKTFKKPGYTNTHMLKVHSAPHWSSEFRSILGGSTPQ